MATRRSKYGATRRSKSKSRRSKQRTSWRWFWLLTGILLGGLLAGTVVTKITNSWNLSHSEKKVAAKTKETSNKRAKSVKKDKNSSTLDDIKFEFYKLLPDSSETRLNASSATHTSLKKTYRYTVQAGSFRKLTEADELKARLTLNGLKPNIHKITLSDKKVWYRVQIGPFNHKQDALAQQKKLLQQHINGIIVKE